MKIEKIGSVKVNVFDILNIYRFLKDYISWDSNFFFDYLKDIGESGKDWITIKVSPKFLLVPKYRSSNIEEELVKIADIKRGGVIKIENLSEYNIFRVERDGEKKEGGITDYWGWIEVDGFKREKAKLGNLGFIVEYSLYGGYNHTGMAVNFSYWNDDIEKIEESLKTLRWAENRNYSYFSEERGNGVAEKIRFIEDSFMVILNFLYNVYANGYTEEKFYKLFDPVASIVESYGDTFEDVVSSIKLITTLV